MIYEALHVPLPDVHPDDDRDHWFTYDEPVSSYFHFDELKSKGNGTLFLNLGALRRLNLLRSIVDQPLVIYSAYRDPEHNKLVGGVPNSYHTKGKAFDIKAPRRAERLYLLGAAFQAGFRGFGLYPNFIHVDVGKPRYWIKT